MDYFTMLVMKQSNSKKHVFLGLTRFLSFSPMQRCMVRVTNDNYARRLTDYGSCKSIADERQKVDTFARNTQFVRFWVQKGKTTGISFDPGLRFLTLVYLKRLVFDSQKYLSVNLMHEIIR